MGGLKSRCQFGVCPNLTLVRAEFLSVRFFPFRLVTSGCHPVAAPSGRPPSLDGPRVCRRHDLRRDGPERLRQQPVHRAASRSIGIRRSSCRFQKTIAQDSSLKPLAVQTTSDIFLSAGDCTKRNSAQKSYARNMLLIRSPMHETRGQGHGRRSSPLRDGCFDPA